MVAPMSGEVRRATAKKRTATGVDKGKPTVPQVLEVRVPGADVVVEMCGEAWRFVLVRDDPPLGVLSRVRP
jgi:hypothetical protein